MSKNCKGCMHFIYCWEDGSEYCYRDKENISVRKGGEDGNRTKD